MKLFYPSNYTAEAKWPVVFLYHGMGGSPETAFIRRLTDDADYIVVGMPYLEDDRTRTPQERDEYMQRELVNLRAARQWLAAHASVDDRRVFLAGISKGGWVVSALAEMDLPSVGGVIILLAGRRFGPMRAGAEGGLRAKPVYIGTGATDPNNMPARRAREFYQRSGAVVTFEEYPGQGHSVPANPPRLRAWLEFHGRDWQAGATSARTADVITQFNGRWQAAMGGSNAMTRYAQLIDLADDPRLPMCDRVFALQVQTQLAALRDRSPVREEWLAETKFNRLVLAEACIQRLDDMRNVLEAYRTLAQMYPDTYYGKQAAQYAPTLEKAYQKSMEATRRANPEQGTATNATTKPITPSFPVSGAGPPVLIPVQKGNKIIFKQPGQK